jgi:hypothetical protein
MLLWATVTTKVFTWEFVRHFDPESATKRGLTSKIHTFLFWKAIQYIWRIELYSIISIYQKF